jgi:hypothetical protein
MPPKFCEDSFKFEKDQEVPDHEEVVSLSLEGRDESKIWLEGYDTFEGEYYPLAYDIDDMPTAFLLQAARLRELERTQPSESSGGQDVSGIQDRAFIRHPDDGPVAVSDL